MQTQITLDWVQICRYFGALSWGILLAVFLQVNRMGRFLAKERTWIAVVIGVGGDLLLGVGAQWWVSWIVVALSSLGIIVRSLINEHSETEPALNRYKTKWAMESCVDRCGDVITALEKALQAGTEAERVVQLSRALSAAHKASRDITFARYGEPERKS